MAKKRGKQKDDGISDNIKFVKELQLTTSYYTLLLFFAIIALYKIPGVNCTNLKSIVTETYWVIGILAVFSLFYQFHIAIALWKYREEGEINKKCKKISLVFYTACFVVLIGLVAFITCKIVAQGG